MKILITGFSAFADIKVNPSQVIIDDIMHNNRLSFPNLEITCSVLPTEYASAEVQIINLIDSVSPNILICLGVAPGSTELRLERVAHNIDDTPIADNAGDIRDNHMIMPNGAPAYFSTFPLREIRQDLRSTGLPVRISNHAGTYVCNHVYYTALHHIETNNLDVLCGFMHIPLLSDVNSGTVAAGHLQREDVLRALKQILSFLYQRSDC